MRAYELVTIVNPEVDGEALSNIIDKVSKFISEKGGSVDEVSQRGKRKLAYPLRKFREGNYVLARFNLEPELVKRIEGEIQSWEEVLRLLVIKVED